MLAALLMSAGLSFGVSRTTLPVRARTTSNWSGLEVSSLVAQPESVAMSTRLPPFPAAVGNAISSSVQESVWVGVGGDFAFGSKVGDWLPQAGWTIAPFGRKWTIEPWAAVWHQSNDQAQFPGWFGKWLLVPVGSRLQARISRERGVWYVRLVVATRSRTTTFVRKLPILPGEPRSYPVAEAILETPTLGSFSANLSPVPDPIFYTDLAPSAPFTLTATVRYGDSAAPSVHELSLVRHDDGPKAQTRVMTAYETGAAVNAQARITLDSSVGR